MRLTPLFLLLGLTVHGQNSRTVDLSKVFGTDRAAFCLYDLKTEQWVRFNPSQCTVQYSPCSTFKIPNSLIGLETGVIRDTAFVIPWDPIRHPKDKALEKQVPYKFWYQDLSLKQAFRFSSVWYYQELVRRVGAEEMTKRVGQLNYGNGDTSGGVDVFWLCNSLRISLEEQIDFLKRMYNGTLTGISEKSIRAVKQIMFVETTPDGISLYAKSGSGDCLDNQVIGWYVGFVETRTGPKIFAWNILLPDFPTLQKINRAELTKKLLECTSPSAF